LCSFYFLTWNVVTTQPLANEHLLKLCNTQADFIAVGLQEVKSQPQNLVVDALNEDSWTNALRSESLSSTITFLSNINRFEISAETHWHHMAL
jgi:exonuclease III